MRAPAARKLCTLSSYFRSHLHLHRKTSPSSSSSELPQRDSGLDLLPAALKFDSASPPEDPPDVDDVANQLSSILYTPPVKKLDDEEKRKRWLDIPWLPDISNGEISHKRKEVSRGRKGKWIFKCTGDDQFDRLLKKCVERLGTSATVEVFGHLGRETGLKEFNTLIKLCIKKAREADGEYIAIEEMSKAFHLFKIMRECGFQIEEQTYQPLLQYIVDMGMAQEFQLFSDVIKADNPSSISRLGYYEMTLWIRVTNEEMIRDICEYITVEDSEDTSALRESYLLALCESDRKTQILDVLKNIDIKKLTSAESIATIFQSLGRLLLESDAENLLLDLRAHDHDADNISNFIASYAVSIPNLAVRNFS